MNRVYAASLGLALALAACTGRPLVPVVPADLLEAHREDARASAAAADGAFPSLAEFEQQVLAIRDAWDKRLQAPESLLTFHDFSTPERAALREAATAEGFAASLADGFSLEGLLAAAFVRNPALESARRKLRGTIEQYAQVTYLDTVMRQYASFLRGAQTGIGPALPMDSVAAQFPFPGTLELKAAVVGHAVEMARAEYERTLSDVVTAVRVACAEYAYLAPALAITRETVGYLRQIEETARSKLATGTAQKSHVLQTQVQIAQLENDLITLERQRDTVRVRLLELLDLPVATRLGTAEATPLEPVPTNREALEQRARERQPAILAATARAARKGAMIELAEQASYPALSPGLSLMEGISFATGGSTKAREPFGTRPKGKPDPWFGSKESYLREARSAEQAARKDVATARNRTLSRLTDAWNALDTARRLYELYTHQQIGQAEQAYRDASSAYANDRVEFMSVLDALRQYLRFQLDRQRAERDHHQAYARLEAALGGAPP